MHIPRATPIAFAPKVSGYVTQLNIDDNTYVHKGDLLLKIDPRDYLTARDQARANLSLAQAQLSSSQVDLEIARVRAPATLQQAQAQLQQAQANRSAGRARISAPARRRSAGDDADQYRPGNTAQMQTTKAAVANGKGAGADRRSWCRQTIQAAEDTVRERQAQVAQAEANLAQAEVNLSYTELRAPADWLDHASQCRSRHVRAGRAAGVLHRHAAATGSWRISRKLSLPTCGPGRHVSIDVDAYPNLHLHGHVDSIQAGSGARFSAFPAENATGNFVKIVRRVPVKIIIDSGLDDMITACRLAFRSNRRSRT